MTVHTDNNNNIEKTEVLYGAENAMGRLTVVMSRVGSRADVCGDSLFPSFSMVVEPIKKGYIDFKNRGVKIRFITEIKKDNINYCKELMQFVDELPHMDGVKGNMAISESEYVATAVLQESQPVTQTIYSNAKAILEQHRYFFENLWNKAIPAEQRIMEIEEGIEPVETKVFEDKEKIFNHMKSVLENASERSVCSSSGGMQVIYNNFFDEYKKIVDKKRKGQGRGIRWIVSIDKDNTDLVRTFLEEGIQVRHAKYLTPMNFAVDNKYFHATIDRMEEGKIMQSLLISNEPVYIRHYNSVFEELWKIGIDAIDRIKDLEAGVDLADIEVIPSSSRVQEMYLDIVRLAKEEILWIFPTNNAFVRQDKIGAIPLAIQAAREKNVKVRILTPANNLIEKKYSS